MFAGLATLIGPDCCAAIEFAIRAEVASEATEARFAISFQSLAVSDIEVLETFWITPTALVDGAEGDAFAANGVSTNAEETDTAAEMRRTFELNI